MMDKKIILMLLAFLALSLPVGAAVISVDFEIDGDNTPNTGDIFYDGAGFTTGTDTEWNIHYVGRDARWRPTSVSGPLTTMDGSGTSFDVTFTLGGDYHADRGDFVYLDSGTKPFSYSGLVAGEEYDIRFFSYKILSKFTIDGVTKITDMSTHTATFTDVVADENGVIEGTWGPNPNAWNPSITRFYGTQIRGNFDAMKGSPSGGELVSSATDTPLSWTNLANPDPNNSDVYLQVYCEQNADPNALAASGMNIDTATVDTTVLGDYYWRVDTYFDYVDENNKGAVTRGFVYHFVSVADVPVTSVDAGSDMISWSGEPVGLSADVVDDGKSAVTYSWSADPNTGVMLTEVPDDGDDLSSNSANPTITVTKATNNPSAVTVTVFVFDAGNPEAAAADSMTIDVYDDACKAAIATDGLKASDINGDCNTNLTDLAIAAESWLIDTRISGPVQ